MSLKHYLMNKYRLNGRKYPFLDCWGLVVYWYRKELKIELNEYTDLSYKTMSDGEAQEMAHFILSDEPSEGSICAFYDNKGLLFHVGVFTRGKLLHTHKNGTKWESVHNAIKFQNVTVRYFNYECRS